MTQQTPIPVVIIGGYLGSGKTTLINHCLQNGLTNAAIIVNDFGDINIDAALISQYSSDTFELTNGCICCSIGESLAETFFSILDRPQLPELIVIETSGVSDPASVAAYGYIKGLTNAGVLVLVDTTQAVDTFNQPLISNSFQRQISAAHILAMTKTDLASTDQITETRQLLQQLAPSTQIVEASPHALVELIDAPHRQTTPPSTPSDGHPLSRSTKRFDDPPSRHKLQVFLDSLPESVIRVKGIVALDDASSVLVQKTGPHLSVIATSLPSTGLVLLATNQSHLSTTKGAMWSNG